MSVLDLFHPVVAQWFGTSFAAPTAPQAQGWPRIASGASTLLLAPTGSGKTLTGFLWCINRLMFEPPPEPRERCRVLYISPLKALAVDVERNLRAPLAGISRLAREQDVAHHRTGGRDSDRGYAGRGARPVHAASRRHPDHHAGVALPAADVERARGAAQRAHRDRRRDSRDGGDQARRAPGPVARTARGDRARPHPADRPLGDAAPPRRGRALPRRRGRRG